eukprot:TRINITY_DN7651_c0_g1_i4.p2 TRINITY_DN7651_c0_g1~~TRINITY_DN7651_c0_g1_i4.p2  ORF type:complete len:130 (+),score=2.57 TRINITY_DN7651_c0_g1_i4:779-1168(+)
MFWQGQCRGDHPTNVLLSKELGNRHLGFLQGLARSQIGLTRLFFSIQVEFLETIGLCQQRLIGFEQLKFLFFYRYFFELFIVFCLFAFFLTDQLSETFQQPNRLGQPTVEEILSINTIDQYKQSNQLQT